MWTDNKFAFDRSARSIDADGRLHVTRSHISKAAVNPYYGKEIPEWQKLGLAPDKIYRLYRDPVELERGAATFERNYILSEHVPLTVENIADDPELKQLIVGSIGSRVEFSHPYLDADLCIWDRRSIAGIETEKVIELSCAYRYDVDMTPGVTSAGEAYDGRMTNIRGNHLALVEVGRAGPDVFVADENPFKKELAMKLTPLGKAMLAAIGLASPKLAEDASLSALVGTADRKNFDRKDVASKLVAMDATLNPQQLGNVIDALLDVEQETEPVVPQVGAGDASPAEQVKAMLAGKVDDALIEQICGLFAAPAKDEAADPEEKKELGMKKEEVNAAMDAYGKNLRAELSQAFDAARDVRSVVGDVIGMDSAAEIYAFALDHLKVDHKDVEGVPALRALFKVASCAQAPAPVVAQDSAGLLQKFPQAARFARV